MKKIREYQAWFDALENGKVIKQAIKAKNIQMLGSGVAGTLGALVVIAGGFGYQIPVNPETLVQVGSACGSLFYFGNLVLTAISSDKVGLPFLGNKK